MAVSDLQVLATLEVSSPPPPPPPPPSPSGGLQICGDRGIHISIGGMMYYDAVV